jgi:hypothetical protein
LEEPAAILKMAAAGTYEILLPIYEITERHVPGDCYQDTHHHENLKSFMHDLS